MWPQSTQQRTQQTVNYAEHILRTDTNPAPMHRAQRGVDTIQSMPRHPAPPARLAPREQVETRVEQRSFSPLWAAYRRAGPRSSQAVTQKRGNAWARTDRSSEPESPTAPQPAVLLSPRQETEQRPDTPPWNTPRESHHQQRTVSTPTDQR